jgi:hypothetical protein
VIGRTDEQFAGSSLGTMSELDFGHFPWVEVAERMIG